MRYSLRYKAKIDNSHYDGYYDKLKKALDKAFEDGKVPEIHEYPKTEGMICVDDVCHTDACYQFVIISKTYDVLNLSYYGAAG